MRAARDGTTIPTRSCELGVMVYGIGVADREGIFADGRGRERDLRREAFVRVSPHHFSALLVRAPVTSAMTPNELTNAERTARNRRRRGVWVDRDVGRLRRGDFKIAADFASEEVVDLAMPRHRRRLTSSAIYENRVAATFAQKHTTVPFETTN